jgi:hypothetical protein
MAAPQIFQTQDAPRYIHGFIAHIVIYGVYVVLVLVTRAILMRRNIKKCAVSSETTDAAGPVHDLAFQDLTDQENPNFRYVY